MPNLSIATNEVAIILFIWEIVSRAPREENIAFCINWVGGVIRRCGLRGILGLFFSLFLPLCDKIGLTCDRNGTYVAIKISISKPNPKSPNRESTVLQTLATAAHDANQPGYQYLMMMKDFFEITGPNGRHECLVLELLGPSVADYLDAHSYDERLPGELAKRVVKQTLLGLAFLHERGIAHGGMLPILLTVTVPIISIHLPNPHPCDLDLHTRNLAFTIPSLQALREEDFIRKLGRPETGTVQRTDGQPLESSLPRYLVRPTSYHQDIETSIKIIDFGQSFFSRDESPPDTLHTPFPYRAPEIIFRDKLDYRVDLWSMACLVRFLSYASQGVASPGSPTACLFTPELTIQSHSHSQFFELLTAQTIFDNIVPAPAMLIRQMLETVSDNDKELLPDRWKLACQDLLDNERRPPLPPSSDDEEEEDRTYTLQTWLEETYFNNNTSGGGVEKRTDFSREDISRVGMLIGRMLRLEPLDREEAREVLRDEWFC